jgi:hypothetical protein
MSSPAPLVWLRPAGTADAYAAYELMLSSPWSFRWCTDGTPVSLDDFAHIVWELTTSRYAVISGSSPGSLLGFAVSHSSDGSGDACKVDIILTDVAHQVREFRAATELMLETLWAASNWHKIYLELPDPVYRVVAPAMPDLIKEEGRLRDFYLINATLTDMVICTGTRRP